MDMSTVKNLALLAFMCGAAYAVYRNRKKILGAFIGKRTDVQKRKSVSANKTMQDVCNAFMVYANNFQGLYEPLYKASQGTLSQERKSNVLKEWDIRMGNISLIPIGLKSWWTTIVANLDSLSDKELQKQAAQVMEMIKACGIIRDNQKKLTAKSDTSLYYQNSEGKTWSIGQELLVESPCWYVRSTPVRVIEKGYCEII